MHFSQQQPHIPRQASSAARLWERFADFYFQPAILSGSLNATVRASHHFIRVERSVQCGEQHFTQKSFPFSQTIGIKKYKTMV